VPGLSELWNRTRGDPGICIAVLDGPVDLTHPCFRGAQLKQLESLASNTAGDDAASRHGTHVASILFGQPGSPVAGIAPFCRGVSIPIFEAAEDDSFRLCSQTDLARAIGLALQHGANVINVSGGELASAGMAYPLLENAVRQCARQGLLIVAAAGNQGCDCLHVPAALDSVLVVGGMDNNGRPLQFSNWGRSYLSQGILAPAENISGAAPGGNTTTGTGTSYATPIVSGIAALLLSLQKRRGEKPDPALVRQLLLRTALDCAHQPVPDCRRLLAGRLNIPGALTLLLRSKASMENHQTTEPQPEAAVSAARLDAPAIASVRFEAPAPPIAPAPNETPAPRKEGSCGCGCGGKTASAPQMVYALGQLGYDLKTEARRDSLAQKMAHAGATPPTPDVPYDIDALLIYLRANPWDAAAIEWTLTLDGIPIYAIRPQGPFGMHAYEHLRECLRDQHQGSIDRISVPGTLAGKATLLNGQVLPVIVPDLRGMYSWNTTSLVQAVVGNGDGAASREQQTAREVRSRAVRNFLQRVYHDSRNLGVAPQERAMNFAATNAFEIDRIYESAINDDMELDTIDVTPSPISRPGSDCWDVQLYFFYPQRQVQTVRKVFRFTVDVSDVVPVTVGPTRSWFVR
jgi:hypothetical protein